MNRPLPFAGVSGCPLAGHLPTLVRQGKFVKIDNMPLPPSNHKRAKRGVCKPFGPGPRRRLLQTVAKIDPSALPVFVTLTYGRDWPRDPRLWKVHLHRFIMRMTRMGRAGVWKLEPQRRGAPHFHLLIYGGKVPMAWLAKAWAKCSDDESPDHIKAGTRVESIRSGRGAMYYCAKYIAKPGAENDLEPEWSRAGRWWGVFNDALMPWAPEQSRTMQHASSALVVVERVIRSVHVKRNKGKPLGEHIRPTSAFIESDDFTAACFHQAKCYAETIRHTKAGAGRTVEQIAGEIMGQIFLDPPSLAG